MVFPIVPHTPTLGKSTICALLVGSRMQRSCLPSTSRTALSPRGSPFVLFCLDKSKAANGQLTSTKRRGELALIERLNDSQKICLHRTPTTKQLVAFPTPPGFALFPRISRTKCGMRAYHSSLMEPPEILPPGFLLEHCHPLEKSARCRNCGQAFLWEPDDDADADSLGCYCIQSPRYLKLCLLCAAVYVIAYEPREH